MTADRTGAGPLHYGRVAVCLHWAIAFFILLNLAIGPFMEGLREPARTLVVRLHQSSGITVLLLTAVRVAWRLTHRPPPLDAYLTRPERVTAKTVHFLAYLAMVGLPLSGWAIISAHPRSYVPGTGGAPAAGAATPRVPKRIMIWGLVPLTPIALIQSIADEPDGPARQDRLHGRLARAHAIAGYTLLALLVIHVVGALKHQWIDRQPELARMGWSRVRRREPFPSRTHDP